MRISYFESLLNKIQQYHLRIRFFNKWINMIFNSLDQERLKCFGPDRTCAEWLLRNGAKVKFINENHFISDYNKLPTECKKFFIKEVDASDSCIMHYGFAHFKGCEHIEKLILHKCCYLEDTPFNDLSYLNNSLKYLQISECKKVTDKSLSTIPSLDHLQSLVLYSLPGVKDKRSLLNTLKEKLPNCEIKLE